MILWQGDPAEEVTLPGSQLGTELLWRVLVIRRRLGSQLTSAGRAAR